MTVYVGIDCGGSHTICAAWSYPQKRLGISQGPGCNLGRMSGQKRLQALRRLADLADAALDDAGLDRADRLIVCAGAAGLRGAQQQVWQEDLRRQLKASFLILKTDGEIALQAAFWGGPGIVLMLGTGSIAYGLGTAGPVRRSGGWGYIIGDDGSAFAAGRRALRYCLAFLEDNYLTASAPPEVDDPLVTEVLQTLQAVSAEDILQAVYTSPDPVATTASLARCITKAVRARHKGAQGILRQTAAEATRPVLRLWRAVGPVTGVALGGGFALGSPEVFRAVSGNLERLLPDVTICPLDHPPVLGALHLAFSCDGCRQEETSPQDPIALLRALYQERTSGPQGYAGTGSDPKEELT